MRGMAWIALLALPAWTSGRRGATYRADDHVVEEHEEAREGDGGADDEELDAVHVFDLGLGLDGRLLLLVDILLLGRHRDVFGRQGFAIGRLVCSHRGCTSGL